MNKRKIICFLICYILIGIGSIYYLSGTKMKKNDVIEVNRIVKSVLSEWDDLGNGDYKEFTYPFCVIGINDEVLYQSTDTATNTIRDAMENGDLMIPAQRDGTLLGTVIITTNPEQNYQDTKNGLLVLFACIYLLLLGAMIYYYFYLHQTILSPFLKMKDFTQAIAMGNLDVPLADKGNKAFSPFINSFEVMRDELKKAREKEYLANRSKKELVASLSHDIKTPVTAIKLACEVLLVKTKEANIKEKLQAIYQRTEQIDRLVTDLFHTTLEDMEELTVKPEEIYSKDLLALIKEADCFDNVCMDDMPDCMVYADAVRLSQVFANIIYNSYKYANTKIDIHFQVEHEFLAIEIQDYGPGADPEELPLLFNRFYRGKNATNVTGSGLGLYICKKLLEKMGGEIYCSNRNDGFLTLVKLRLV